MGPGSERGRPEGEAPPGCSTNKPAGRRASRQGGGPLDVESAGRFPGRDPRTAPQRAGHARWSMASAADFRSRCHPGRGRCGERRCIRATLRRDRRGRRHFERFSCYI
jgi:hypothetical protein